jgi:hypothetical protein
MNDDIKQQVIQDWIASVEAQQKQLDKYNKLLDFVKAVSEASCCNACNCLSCDAVKLLGELGEWEPRK